jgi:molecular chaperone Hsp33
MITATPVPDRLRPFQLERSGLRGRIVRLDHALDDALRGHGYPDAVAQALGELIALAGTLAGGLKFDGSFSLQARGDGPVRLLVADCTNAGVVRGYAGFSAESLPRGTAPGLGELLGKGVMAVTVDQSAIGGDSYQGIVALEETTLEACMLSYFRQSEQIPTGLRLAVRRDRSDGRWRGGAVVVQAMPGIGGQAGAFDEDGWLRTMLLLSTLADSELLDPDLPLDDLLWRLFHEEGVRVFDWLPLVHGCSCSADRFARALATFPLAELEEMAQDDGVITASCQFCGRSYGFRPDQVARRDAEPSG